MKKAATPAGQWVFLEVNEMGQFLFVELYAGMPLLEAFSDFLIHRDPAFRWQPKEPSIRFSEIHDSTRQEMIEACRIHIPVDNPSYYDGKKKSKADLPV